MKNAIYLLIDTEFSGQHPEKHGLIEIAMAALDKNLEVVDRFQSYVSPPSGVILDPESMAISGITHEQMATGIDYPALCIAFIHFVKQNFEQKAICVGQFYPAEFMYLNYIFGYCGYERLLMDQLLGNDFLDTKVLANLANAKARIKGEELPFVSTSLSKAGGLKDALGVSQTDFKAHTAMGDVLATREVLKKFLEL